MFKSISKLYRIKNAVNLFPFTSYSKRTTSILPTFQLQQTTFYYNASIKSYSSSTVLLPEQRIVTEILNDEKKCTIFKAASDNMELQTLLVTVSKESPRRLKAKPALQRKRANDFDAAIYLNEFRNGNLEDPGYSISALVKNYFLEKNVAKATTQELYQYFEEFGFYATKSEKEKERWKKSIRGTLTDNPNCYHSNKQGSWIYLKSPVFNSIYDENDAVKNFNDNEYVSQIYKPNKDFTWNGNTFILCGYKFCLRRRLNYTYAECVNCKLLYNLINKRIKKGCKKIKPPKIGLLKINDDGCVEGCPWKPSGFEHFCHQDQKIRTGIKKERRQNTFQRRLEILPKLYCELEESYALSFSGQFNLDNIEPKLGSFFDDLIKAFPYCSSQKLCFLYFLRYVGNPAIKYYGVTSDYYTRLYKHLNDDNKEIEMIISPLGQRNLLFVKELEALLIRLSKEKLLNDGDSIENSDLGEIATMNMNYKDYDGCFSQDIIDAINQLIHFTLKYGQVIKKFDTETSNIRLLSKKIISSRARSKYNQQQLNLLEDATKKSIVTCSESLFLSTNAGFMPPELISFLCEIEAIHKYTPDQVPVYLYFLKYPNNSSVKRYGISKNLQERLKDHKQMFGKSIEMIIAPIGPRSVLFIEELEAMLIRMSKMRLLNDGKSILNKYRDDGNFHTKYEIFKAIVDHENHPRRQFLIKALDQLIAFTLHSNIKVENLFK